MVIIFKVVGIRQNHHSNGEHHENHQILKFSKNVQSRKTWHSRGKDHYWRLKENNAFNKSDLDALRQALEEAYRIFYDEVWEPMEMLDHLAGGSHDQSLNVSVIGGFSNRHLKKMIPRPMLV